MGKEKKEGGKKGEDKKKEKMGKALSKQEKLMQNE
jgi:hypothetical protein